MTQEVIPLLFNTNERPLMFIRPRNSDKRILEEALGLFSGLHVNDTLPQFMTDFVRNLGKPFILDPMVYIFTLPPKQLLNKKKGTLRPSIDILGKHYGSLYQEAAGKCAITPTDLLADSGAIEAITKNVLKYQKIKFAGQLQLFNPYYNKYKLWDDGDCRPANVLSTLPEVLVPPYFLFKKPDDLWYRISIECAKTALSLRNQGDYIFPVLLIDSEILGDLNSIKHIVDDFGSKEFDGFFLWVNGFKEESEKPVRLGGLLQLIKGLSSDNKPVFKLFGSYFSALLFAYGLKGFSCGLGYGSDKNIFKFGASGGKTVPKYYIPRLHRSIQLGDAERLLKSYPSLRCNCKICGEVYGENIDKFTEMQKRGRCEAHFLNVRKNELKEIGERGLNRAFSEMEKTIKEFNRDLLVNTESLKQWCEVLNSTTR